MKLPLILSNNLPSNTKDKWLRQFQNVGRDYHEGIWLRTQEPVTSNNSGYSNDTDKRWKFVHFIDRYGIEEQDGHFNFLIKKVFLWWNTALPIPEAEAYLAKTKQAMKTGNWQIKEQSGGLIATKGDLTAVLEIYDSAVAQQKFLRPLPRNYRVIDIEVRSNGNVISDEEIQRPWKKLRMGMRMPLKRGNPKITNDIGLLKQYFPLQVELGCGPSIEAGVPPLAMLHHAYAISNPENHRFLFSDEDTLPVRFFSDTEQFYHDAAQIYIKAIHSRPDTRFYKVLKRLYDQGIVLGPIFTNNYDGLSSDAGMTEHYLRRFEESHIFPDVQFDPRAKALLVIGSHADRRKLQEKARVQGLQVIYVDPESYLAKDGHHYPYQMEAPQDSDIVYQMSADTFAEKIEASGIVSSYDMANLSKNHRPSDWVMLPTITTDSTKTHKSN